MTSWNAPSASLALIGILAVSRIGRESFFFSQFVKLSMQLEANNYSRPVHVCVCVCAKCNTTLNTRYTNPIVGYTLQCNLHGQVMESPVTA